MKSIFFLGVGGGEVGGCGVRVETGREGGKRGDASVCVWGGGGGGDRVGYVMHY